MIKINKKHRGRPGKFDSELGKRLCFLAEKGFTEKEMCHALQLSRDTLHRWKKNPEFSDTIRRAKEKADVAIELALYARARGYYYLEERRTYGIGPDGKEVLKGIETWRKYLPPDIRACMFWLCNRSLGKWRFRPEQKQQQLANVIFLFSVIGPDGQPMQIPFDPKKPGILAGLHKDARSGTVVNP